MVRSHTRISKNFTEATACIVALAACLIAFVANQLPDQIFLPLFCRIPAHIASGYYNAELALPTLIFSVHGIAIQVSRSCGAVTFFSMCAALLLVRLWQRSHRVREQRVALSQNSGFRSQNTARRATRSRETEGITFYWGQNGESGSGVSPLNEQSRDGSATMLKQSRDGSATMLKQRKDGAITRSHRLARRILFSGLSVVIVAWVLTILVNSARLILIVPVTAVSRILPERFGASVHMASGMLVFMSAFVILWFVSENVFLKRSKNE